MSEAKFPPQANEPTAAEPQNSDAADSQAKDRPAAKGITRRGFLKGAGVAAAGTALLEGAQVFTREAAAATHGEQHGVKELGPGAVPVTLHINGKEQTVQLEPRTTLADALACPHGADRHEGCLRSRIVFRLYRAAGQYAGEQLHDAGDGRDRAQGNDD